MDYKLKCPQQIKVILDHHEINKYRINQIANCKTPLDARILLSDLFDKIYDDTGFYTKNSDIIVRATWEEKQKIVLLISKRPILSKKFKNIRFQPKSFVAAQKIQIFSFDNFEDLLASLHHIQFYHGRSDLYENSGSYFLILKYNIKNGHPNQKLSHIMSEFAYEMENPNIKECFLQEHGHLIVKKNALRILNQHFKYQK